MLPFCDRVVSVPRSKYLPSHSRGIPVPKEPTTIGGHLRKRRLQLRIYQSEAAQKLKVSTVTLSRWESDRLHPTWPYWPRIVAYLGYDPFVDPALGRPKGNESRSVAILSSEAPVSIGQRIARRRMEMKKTRNECAKMLGISAKTLWGWETERRLPSPLLRDRIRRLLGHLEFDQCLPAST